MKVSKDFFDKLREEVRCTSNSKVTEVQGLSIDDVLKIINGNGDSNFDSFLKQIDWFSIDPMELIPRERVRAFAKRIIDTDKRHQTLKFLRKYEDYYFKDINGVVGSEEHYDNMGRQYFDDVIGVVYSISDFHKELTVLIEQIESEEEFSTGKMNELIAEVTRLQDLVRGLQEEKHKQYLEIQDLKGALTENRNQPCHGEVPDLDAICEYAKTLSREEIKTIQNMLFSLMDITDREIKKKITSIKPESAPTNIAMGDIVTNKIVKQ